MMGHDDLQAALRQLPVPEPGPDLLSRILRSRVMGVRVANPTRSPALAWRWLAAAAVVVVLIGSSWIVSLSLSRLGSSPQVREPLDDLFRGVWRLERQGSESGKTPLPKYELITSNDLDVTRLHEGVWMYTLETTTDDIVTNRTGEIGIRLARTLYRGQPAWMVNTGRQLAAQWDRWGDTTYLDPLSLRPQQVVGYGNRGRTRISQTFLADSGRESIVQTGPIQRSWRGSVLLPFPRNALFVSDWSISRLVPVLPAIPFSRRWSGTLYQIVFISQAGIKSIAPVDMKVVGTDRVTVPAGVYDCWRVEIGSRFGDAENAMLWISRDKGWLIQKQVRGGDFAVTTRLERYEPGS